MVKNNGLTSIMNKRGYKLLDIYYNKQLCLEQIENLENNNEILESEICDLYNERIKLVDSILAEKQKIILKLLDKKMNRMFLTGIMIFAIYFIPMTFIISIFKLFLYQILVSLLCGIIMIGSFNALLKKIDKTFEKRQNKMLEEFNITKGKEINKKINSIDKNIENNKSTIFCNLEAIEKYEKIIKLSDYYVKQMKYLNEKMCKAEVDIKGQKKYKLKQDCSLKLKEKVKKITLTKNANY